MQLLWSIVSAAGLGSLNCKFRIGVAFTEYATYSSYAASPKVSLTASSAAKASAEVHPVDNHGAQGFERLE